MKTLALLLSLALPVAAFAVSPPPDGGYPNNNTAEGEDALFSLTSGSNNTALGYRSMYNTTTAQLNVAVGDLTLQANTTGSFNTAVGSGALAANTNGEKNTGLGDGALSRNTMGDFNAALGFLALNSNVTGGFNVALGATALEFNATGSNNVAVGNGALEFNNGSNNVAVGVNALVVTKTGDNNVAVGGGALASCKGARNIALGNSAGSIIFKGSDNIAIGNVGEKRDGNRIRIGTAGTHTSTYVAGISGVTVAGGVGVVIDTDGQLGTVTSSARYKEQVKPMQEASAALLALEPVTFRYKKELDPNAIPQFGLIAEQVAKVDPDLVARDAEGQPYTVRYEAVNAMLLNEFLKEHRKVEALGSEVAELKAMLREQAAQIQQVKAQVQAGAPALRLVKNR